MHDKAKLLPSPYGHENLNRPELMNTDSIHKFLGRTITLTNIDFNPGETLLKVVERDKEDHTFGR